MNRLRVRLAVLVAGLLAAVSAVPASADYCYIKIKWDDQRGEWQWASDYDWECAVCMMGITTGGGASGDDVVETVLFVVDEASRRVGHDVEITQSNWPDDEIKKTLDTVDGIVTPVAAEARGLLASVSAQYPFPLPAGPGCPPGWVSPDDV